MKRLVLLSFIFAAAWTWAQEAEPDRVTVPFSDPSRPKTLKASLINGSISVKGYDGKEAIVEARSRSESRRRRAERERADGLHRIDVNATGLTVEESDNVITVGTRIPGEGVNLDIQVPFNTSLKLHAVNGRDISVDQVTGDIEIESTNGNATATHVSGAAVVHSLNGKVLVSVDKFSGKPLSFSSLNGDIDVTLPADTKARLKLKTDHGAVYSDFDIAMDRSAGAPTVEDNRSGNNGRYRVRFDRTMIGTINGGGPEVSLTTFNGNIYLRKAK
jgi:DUF4097 and DUF4098 domain-containing protein YvlB